MSNNDGKSDFWRLFGWALVWLGFGSCCMMTQHSSDKPIIEIHVIK